MKTLLSIMVQAVVVGMLVVPIFAQEPKIDAGNLPSGMPAELEGIITGRDGFSVYDEEALIARFSGTSVAKPEGMPLQVWHDINSRDGFSARSSGGNLAKVNGMSAQLWSDIAGRDGFDVYDTGEPVPGSPGNSLTRPAGMPADLWPIISGRDGFSTYSGCAAC